MDRGIAQIAIPLIGIILGAAAAVAFKKNQGLATAVVGAAVIILVAAAITWAYSLHFDWHRYGGGNIPPGYACDRQKDRTEQQCAAAAQHCYPAPGALSGPGQAPVPGESRWGYCVSANPEIPQNCAYLGELGIRFGQKMSWFGKSYQCVTPGYWQRDQ